MTNFLPQRVLDELDSSNQGAGSSIQIPFVDTGEAQHPIRKLWPHGFALDAEDTERLPGRVDIYRGAEHMYQCLVIAGDVDDDQRIFFFKRATDVRTCADAETLCRAVAI